MTPHASEPIQLTVIGGFLGAGKTTLLNRLLRDAGDRRLAVLVNDFGAIDIDAELVQSRAGELVSLKNGCICCGVAGDFVAELALLRDRPDPPAHVVVEASGVADPGQIAVLGDLPGYRKDAAVVVADAETVRARAAHDTTGYLVRAQLRAADLLVLNKTDLVDTEQLAQTRAWLRDLAGPSTAIVDASFGQVPIDVVLGAHTLVRPERAPRAHDHAGHEHGDHHHPTFETWSWQGEAAIHGAGLVEAIKELPAGIVRAKGLLHLREDPASRYVLQVVGRRFSVLPDRPWRDDAPSSQLVVIGLAGSVDERWLAAKLECLTSPPP
jgi:G3E family GTPase